MREVALGAFGAFTLFPKQTDRVMPIVAGVTILALASAQPFVAGRLVRLA